MQQQQFIEFLKSRMEGMASFETYGLIRMEMTQPCRSDMLSEWVEELRQQIGSDVRCAEFTELDHVIYLDQVTLEAALRVTRQLRYNMEHPRDVSRRMNAAFGVVIFDSTAQDPQKLLDIAAKATAKAVKTSQNGIELIDYTQPLCP